MILDTQTTSFLKSLPAGQKLILKSAAIKISRNKPLNAQEKYLFNRVMIQTQGTAENSLSGLGENLGQKAANVVLLFFGLPPVAPDINLEPILTGGQHGPATVTDSIIEAASFDEVKGWYLDRGITPQDNWVNNWVGRSAEIGRVSAKNEFTIAINRGSSGLFGGKPILSYILLGGGFLFVVYSLIKRKR